MKQINRYFSVALTLCLASCGNELDTNAEIEIIPKTPVEIVSVKSGSIEDKFTLFGTTFYLKRNSVTASIPAFITDVKVKLGDRVNKGDLLFVLQSKESRALGNDISKIDSTLANFGVIKVRAPATGIVSTLDKQQPGDYVLEGTQLCTIAESSDLVFQVNVPYELNAFAKTGKKCMLVLPDNTEHSAVFTTALTAMNVLSQTQTIFAKCNENLFLPENMIVKVELKKGTQSDKQILPKSCVLSDEMMKEFWIMKLVNDSVAVKEIVTIGNKNEKSIEIITPKLSNKDRIISVGNYGLADTALVNIINTEVK